MKGLQKFFFRIFFCLLVSIWPNNYLLAQNFEYTKATVITQTGISIPVEVADTLAKRALGLGKRDSLQEGWGMLFVFEKKNLHSFWMKDMMFPIDIIWLDNYRVVEIVRHVQPPEGNSKPNHIKPRYPSNFVLEIESGRADDLGIVEGNILRYEF